jgi:Transposase DDE domain
VLGITIQPSAGGHGGTFIPDGIRWVVERSLAWISRYHRLNTIFERTEAHLVAFIEIAFVSILSRRLVRLVAPRNQRLRTCTQIKPFVFAGFRVRRAAVR